MDKVEQFNRHRSLLFSIAYRMLGSTMEAEDMVQETFLRWQQSTQTGIKSAKAFLTSIITRLCIDQLRSARVQREQYVGPWLPEPLLAEQPPKTEESVDLAESLSMAFLVLLESLNPTERAVFLLREVFDYDYAEIARIVGKSEVNCRQLARRARRHVRERRPRFDSSPEERQRLMLQFMDTCINGDLPGLVHMLSDDIVVYTDSGGKAVAARKPIYGPVSVARFLIGLAKNPPPNFESRLAWVNGQPGFVGYEAGRPTTVFSFEIVDGRVRAIHAMRNPDKLQHIPPLEQQHKD